jgi:hypothetical protein
MTRAMRITLLALFFVSVVEFNLKHALMLMTAAAFAILLLGGLWKLRHTDTPSGGRADNISKARNQRPEGVVARASSVVGTK